MTIIPFEKLSPKTLRSLLEEFVTRDGTDSGYTKTTLEQNVAQVKKQLEREDAFIVYDERTKTCNIVHKNRLNKRTEN